MNMFTHAGFPSRSVNAHFNVSYKKKSDVYANLLMGGGNPFAE